MLHKGCGISNAYHAILFNISVNIVFAQRNDTLKQDLIREGGGGQGAATLYYYLPGGELVQWPKQRSSKLKFPCTSVPIRGSPLNRPEAFVCLKKEEGGFRAKDK